LEAIASMNKEQILKFLKVGENSEIEFKKAENKLPKSVWETYSSFSNTSGGYIILGIDETKKNETFEVVGVNNAKNILEDFWNGLANKEKVSCNHLKNSDTQILEVDGKDIIVIYVPRADRKQLPVYINNNPLYAYERFNSGDHLMEKDELIAYFSDAQEKTKDSMVLEEFDISHIEINTLHDYRKVYNAQRKGHQWSELSDEEFLYNINAMDRKTKKLTLAGLLMFGNHRDIVTVCPDYFLDYREEKSVVNERWTDRITSEDLDLWSGNLWDFFQRIVDKLTLDIPTPFALNNNMQRISNTPAHDAIREALTNTLVHAQYDGRGTIVVIKGQNYFQFSNPGLMRVKPTVAIKGGTSNPRNKILHNMFSYCGFGERAGSGLSFIYKAWADRNWIEPEIEQDYIPNRTTLKLKMIEKVDSKVDSKVDGKVDSKLTENQKKILKLISKKPSILREEISKSVGISVTSVSNNLKKLINKGYIERVGADKNGYWKILK